MRKLLYFILLVIGSIIFLMPYQDPSSILFPSFLSFLIPIFLGLVPILFLFALMRKSLMLIGLSLLAIVLAYPHFRASIQFFNKEDIDQSDFKVLSYNVRVFNSYQHLHQGEHSVDEMLKQIKEQNAELVLFQEFYDEVSGRYDVSGKMKDLYPYQYIHASAINRIQARFGMAIFSKYPILSEGLLSEEGNKFNNTIYADIQMPRGDTLRVYNMHLESMSIVEDKVIYANDLKSRWEYAYPKLREGFLNRSAQVKHLSDHAQGQGQAFIIGGDLNDVPYSYTYTRLRKISRNAFERAGQGIGLTYNGKLPLRIDHQFYSSRLRALRYEVLKEMDHSDHFPILVHYEWRKK